MSCVSGSLAIAKKYSIPVPPPSIAYFPLPSVASYATTKTSYEPRVRKVVVLPRVSVSVSVPVSWPKAKTSLSSSVTSTPRKPWEPTPPGSLQRTLPSLPLDVSMRERTAAEPEPPGEPTTASRAPVFETARSPKEVLAVALAHCAMPFSLYLMMPVRDALLTTVMPVPKSRVPAEADIDQPQKKEPSAMVRQELRVVGITCFHTSTPLAAASFIKYLAQPILAPWTGRP
mmetsp:Transcript_101182/g.200990  ORF Transcript_101182/g.200990 Transcript_101182/m.200990 type:complete len:230 (-) Transcript_101182:778-1467(-)